MRDRTKIRKAFANMVIYERPLSRKGYIEIFGEKISLRECRRANLIYENYLDDEDVSNSLKDIGLFKFTEQEMKHITALLEYMVDKGEYITRDKCDEIYPELLGDIVLGTSHRIYKMCRYQNNYKEELAKLPQ